MIVDELHVAGGAVREAEDDAPIGPHRDAPEALAVAFQRMQPEAGKIHVLHGSSRLQSRQDVLDLLDLLRCQPAAVARFVESLQPAVLETADHRSARVYGDKCQLSIAFSPDSGQRPRRRRKPAASSVTITVAGAQFNQNVLSPPMASTRAIDSRRYLLHQSAVYLEILAPPSPPPLTPPPVRDVMLGVQSYDCARPDDGGACALWRNEPEARRAGWNCTNEFEKPCGIRD